MAVEAEAFRDAQAAAKKRQTAAAEQTNANLGRKAKEETLPEIIPEASPGEAREYIAKLVGSNARYISDAKRHMEQHPERPS